MPDLIGHLLSVIYKRLIIYAFTKKGCRKIGHPYCVIN